MATLLTLNASAQTDTAAFKEIPEMVFQNPKLESGVDKKEGAVYRFPNVAPGMDGLLKLVKFSGTNIIINSIDNSTFGWNKALQPEFGINPVTPNQTWWIDFQLTFVEAGKTTKVTADKFQATSIDVDGDGSNVAEFVTVKNSTNTTYSTVSYLANNATASQIQCTKGHNSGTGSGIFDHANNKPVTCTACNGSGKMTSKLFKGAYKCKACQGVGKIFSICKHPYEGEEVAVKGPIDNFSNIDTAGTQVMANYTFNNLNTLYFRMGGYSGARSGGAGIRLNSLWFKSFSMEPANTLPVRLDHFTAAAARGQVNLVWNTSAEVDASHFVLERSGDGKSFADIAVVMTGGAGTRYAYQDKSANALSGIVYYRLKQVDKTGESTYSAIRPVRLEEGTASAEVAITTYPNPVTEGVKVTIPSAWQGRTVTIELISAGGVRVVARQFTSASNTELLPVGGAAPGAYIVRASCEGTTASQRIVKQ